MRKKKESTKSSNNKSTKSSKESNATTNIKYGIFDPQGKFLPFKEETTEDDIRDLFDIHTVDSAYYFNRYYIYYAKRSFEIYEKGVINNKESTDETKKELEINRIKLKNTTEAVDNTSKIMASKVSNIEKITVDAEIAASFTLIDKLKHWSKEATELEHKNENKDPSNT